MCVGEVVIHTDHAVVLVGGTLIGGDQVSSSVAIVCTVRNWKQLEKVLYARIDFDGHAPFRSGVAAAARITGRWQQTSMSKRIGYRGNCCGCLHLTKPLVVCKKECSIVHQRPSGAGAEL